MWFTLVVSAYVMRKKLKAGTVWQSLIFLSGKGSTVITLHESYLKTLTAGSYEITAEFTDGVAKTTLRIETTSQTDKQPQTSDSGNPKTGDSKNIFWWMVIGAFAMALGLILIRMRIRLQKN